jgi:hypothetical protein
MRITDQRISMHPLPVPQNNRPSPSMAELHQQSIPPKCLEYCSVSWACIYMCKAPNWPNPTKQLAHSLRNTVDLCRLHQLPKQSQPHERVYKNNFFVRESFCKNVLCVLTSNVLSLVPDFSFETFVHRTELQKIDS